METNYHINYERIAQAIDYIRTNFKSQPSLDEIAQSVHLSPYHFQRLFTDWAGTSPKQFLQYTSIEYAKSLLQDRQATLFDVADETGLSGTGRLHDLFLKIEGMTPGEYKDGGRQLIIQYSEVESPFGKMFVASTEKGICKMVFSNNQETSLIELQKTFPNASLEHQSKAMHEEATKLFQRDSKDLTKLKLHLRGTEFQLKVWQALLQIPQGKLTTYGKIADQIGSPAASRAVGTAIGSNPVAYLIPCHRVIRQSGHLGGYMWGETRKTAMIGWEAVVMKG